MGTATGMVLLFTVISGACIYLANKFGRSVTGVTADVVACDCRERVSGFDLDVALGDQGRTGGAFRFLGLRQVDDHAHDRRAAPARRGVASNATGRCLYDSETRHALPSSDRGFGYVGQDVALFPHMTVRANIAYGLKGMPRPERDERVAEMLAGLPPRGPRATTLRVRSREVRSSASR